MLFIILLFMSGERNKKYKTFYFNKCLKSFLKKLLYVLPFLLSSNTPSDDTNLIEHVTFIVTRKDAQIGYINIERSIKNDTTSYQIKSDVNARVIINFKATGKEKSVYVKDKLVYSSIFRKINSQVKINESLSLIDGKYFLQSGTNTTFVTDKVIKHNLATLFFIEPVNLKYVYSDKYKRMIEILPLGNHTYKITLPNQSTSVYHFKNFKCMKVELKGAFYKVNLVRESINILK